MRETDAVPDVRGPLRALRNTPILGTYLRAYVAFLLASLLAVTSGAVLLRVGGAMGVAALSAALVAGFAACWAVFAFR